METQGQVMVEPFHLHNVSLLARLQKQITSLCPIESLTRSRPPVWSALMSLLTLNEAGSSTFVLNERRGDGRKLQGFVQIEQPPTRPEMYVRYISPRLGDGLDVQEDAPTVWSRLLNHIVSMACKRGLQRIFANVPDGSEALQILLGLGFSTYTREEILRLAPGTHPQAVAQEGIRPEQSTDVWQLAQLYREVVPHLVLRAEALTDGKGLQAICSPMTWEQGEGFVLEDRAGPAGYGHLMPGRTGHWLTVIVHPRAYDRARNLLDYGLALLNYYPPYPVYCAVRDYQGGIHAPLEDLGFETISLQCRTVKHTTVRITESARTLVPALEKRREATTPTASRTEAN